MSRPISKREARRAALQIAAFAIDRYLTETVYVDDSSTVEESWRRVDVELKSIADSLSWAAQEPRRETLRTLGVEYLAGRTLEEME